MENQFSIIIDQVPQDIYSDTKTIISKNVAIFISKDFQPNKGGLITIGSGVDFICKTTVSTKEYVNIVIRKDLLEEIAFEVIGSKPNFTEIEYQPSVQLLRILSDLEYELINNNERCPLMVECLETQLVIQLLRDTGINKHNFNPLDLSLAKLTTREKQIAVYLIDRFYYDEIAAKLFISKNTLKTHTKNIYKKLNVSGRKELITKVREMYNHI